MPGAARASRAASELRDVSGESLLLVAASVDCRLLPEAKEQSLRTSLSSGNGRLVSGSDLRPGVEDIDGSLDGGKMCSALVPGDASKLGNRTGMGALPGMGAHPPAGFSPELEDGEDAGKRRATRLALGLEDASSAGTPRAVASVVCSLLLEVRGCSLKEEEKDIDASAFTGELLNAE